MSSATPDSFDTIEPAMGPTGQLVPPEALAQLDRLAPKMYRLGDHAWCVVGNGLSNQRFIEGPDGIIAIDTGDPVEEMAARHRPAPDRDQRSDRGVHLHPFPLRRRDHRDSG